MTLGYQKIGSRDSKDTQDFSIKWYSACIYSPAHIKSSLGYISKIFILHDSMHTILAGGWWDKFTNDTTLKAFLVYCWIHGAQRIHREDWLSYDILKTLSVSYTLVFKPIPFFPCFSSQLRICFARAALLGSSGAGCSFQTVLVKALITMC